MTTEERRIDTPHGEARLVVRRARGAVATLLLSHGAGGGIDTRDLAALARRPARATASPWCSSSSRGRSPGRKVATPPATLDAGLVAAANRLKTRTPLVVGGRSAGARSAARCAKQLGASGCLALAFPLHPPGQAGEVAAARAARRPGADAGRPGRARHLRPARGVPDATSTWPSYRPPTTASRCPRGQGVTEAEAMEIIVESTLEWIVREVTGDRLSAMRE